MSPNSSPAAADISTPAAETASELSRKTAASAMLLVGRRVLVLVISALSTAVVARKLGVSTFGQLASAQGLFALSQAVVDLGFSLTLGRELAVDPARRSVLLGAVVQLQSAWGFLLALVLAGIAVSSGLGSVRGEVLLALAPTMLVSGLLGLRQVYFVLYRTRQVAAIDISTNVVQGVATVVVALTGGGALGVAIVIAAGQLCNTLLVGLGARRLMPPKRADRGQMRRVLGHALPLGVASIITTAYFSIDLVLLAWLVPSRQLGEYAGAVKLLNLLVALPGFVMVAALPGLAMLRDRQDGLSEFTTRLWQWLAVSVLPLCVATAVFARPIIDVALGPGYASSASLLRILALAGVFSVVNTTLDAVMTSQRVARAQVVQNSLGLVFNVAANVALAPLYGPVASAWITVATEVIVGAAALRTVSRLVALRGTWRVTSRSLLACAGLAATGLALHKWPLIAVPTSVAVFLTMSMTLRIWPEEVMPALARWRGET